MEAKEKGITVKGAFRLNIEEDGKIVGDSGWHENQVTNLGFNSYLVATLGSLAGSSYVSYMALGSGTVPGAAATNLDGEVEVRAAVTAASSSSSRMINYGNKRSFHC